MNPRHALHPDLNECMLEDRCLMYAPGLYSTGFAPLAPGTNLIAVAGLNVPGGGSGGAPNYPGPSFYYIFIGGGGGGGGISNGAGSSGISIYGLATNNGYVNVSVGAAGTGSTTGGGGAPAPSTNLGYGGNVSSGYGTSLNISNNYGTSANTVGSMPVHSFDSGTNVAPATANGGTASTPTPTPDANTELWNSLLKRNTRNMNGGMTSPSGMNVSGTP
jgi:hypothetical protein